ncbi:MAG TPA: S-layer homology domain-containing protein, partial [Chloroflexia bacterium]|nr:S-layer homology domain-containing protein [Chloroflexia bacterium]
GFGDLTSMNVDDVTLQPVIACGTNTATATGTPPTSTPTVTATATVCGGAGTPGPFAVVSPIATAVYGAGMDSDGTYAYAAGGYSFQTAGMITQFARYNPATNVWTTLSPVPDLNNGEMGVVYDPLNNKLYLFGGENFASSTVANTTRIYDITAGTWSTGAAMPDVRAFFAAAGYYNGKIYLVGGYNTGQVTSAQASVWEYDPVANTFTTTRMLLPHAVGGSGYGIINGHIFVAGGRDAANTVIGLLYDYNIAADTWTARAPMLAADNVPGSAVVNGKLWISGGGNPFNRTTAAGLAAGEAPETTGATQIYNPTADQWTNGPALTVARSFVGGTNAAGYVVAVGGYNGTTTVGTTEVSFNPPPVPCNTATATVAPTNTATATNTATNTVVPSNTATSTVVPSSTATARPSSTATTVPSSTATARPTNTVGPSATPCTLSFTDVHVTDYFYTPVLYLACHGVVSGYADGTFRPYNNTTRSQMVKIVVLGYNKPIVTPAAGGFTFTDVPPANPFFAVIETAAADNIVSGYNCGGPGEPCDSQNRPYFRPYTNVTRGQLSKIDVVAAGWALVNPATPSFEDVVPNTAFYEFVETAYCHGIISGYTCGGPGEPCDTQNRPYFRQYNQATRGQIAKIVYLSVTGSSTCGVTPTATP